MRTVAFILLMFFLPSLAMAEDEPKENGVAYVAYLMTGKYTVIGRIPDSKTMYSGRIFLDARGRKMAFVRTVNHATVRGIATFESPHGCTNSVIRIRFRQEGQWYVGVYEWNVDINNTFELTGRIASNNNKALGWEALFPEP
jgi:hypothetical protein